MTATDWIGSIGVAIMLVAFLLNLIKKIAQDSYPYILMNLIGGALSCLASILLMYWPFIILETAWTLVSAAALIGLMRKSA